MIINYRNLDKNKDFSQLKNSNPFTLSGLIIAIIEDLNDLRQKIEMIERYIVFQNEDNLTVIEDIEKEGF
jgi:hypothetical protein